MWYRKRLNDKDVDTSYGFIDVDGNLAVAKSLYHAVSQRNAQLTANRFREVLVRIA
jgi:hypothetical protein